MPQQTSYITIFFCALMLMLLVIAVQFAVSQYSFWALLYPTGFVVAETMLDWGILFILLASTLALFFAQSLTKFKTIKLRYMVFALIAQLIICIFWIILRLPDFVSGIALRSDNHKAILALFLFLNIELIFFIAFLFTFISLKWAFDQNFIRWLYIDKAKINIVSCFLSMVLFGILNEFFICIFDLINQASWKILSDEAINLRSFFVGYNFLATLSIAAAIFFWLYYKDKLDFLNFALMALFVNLIFASFDFAISFRGYIHLNDELKLQFLQKIFSAIFIAMPVNLMVFYLLTHFLCKPIHRSA